MSEKIIVSCDQAGGVKIDAIGFQGTGCKAATEALEHAFVGSGRTNQDKPEMFTPAVGGTASVGQERM